MSDYDYDREVEGQPAYIYPASHDPDQVPYPDNWLTPKGAIRGGKSGFQDVVPENAIYCPECNRLDPDCAHEGKLEICVVPVPLLLCPSCGIAYVLQALTELTVKPVQPPAAAQTFEALESQCQSDFEREVLAAIRDQGLPLPDEAQKTVYEGDKPIATADFFYAPRILVFVDGSPHYRDYVAAADATKRKRLKAKGYRIVAIKDVEAGLEELITKLGA